VLVKMQVKMPIHPDKTPHALCFYTLALLPYAFIDLCNTAAPPCSFFHADSKFMVKHLLMALTCNLKARF
jgi:hypothetical protein